MKNVTIPVITKNRFTVFIKWFTNFANSKRRKGINTTGRSLNTNTIYSPRLFSYDVSAFTLKWWQICENESTIKGNVVKIKY